MDMELAMRLTDGISIIWKPKTPDDTPEYTGPINKSCWFCFLGQSHSERLHKHMLKQGPSIE